MQSSTPNTGWTSQALAVIQPLGSEETGAHPSYVKALIAAEAEDAVYTEAHSYGLTVCMEGV